MAKSRIAYVNRVTSATLTASSEAASPTRPASYLKSAARWKKWRSATSTADQNVVADFGTSQLVQVVALVDWKRHAGGAIRADYWDGAAYQLFGNFAIPSFNPTKVLTLWNPVGVSTSRIRAYFTNTAVVSDYVELGVLFAGAYYQPTYTVVDGFTVQLVDPSVIVAAVDGQEEAQSRTTFHRVAGLYDYMGQTDVDALRAVFASIGNRAPFLFAVDPDNNDEIVYGRLESIGLQHRAARNFNIPLAVQEAR